MKCKPFKKKDGYCVEDQGMWLAQYISEYVVGTVCQWELW